MQMKVGFFAAKSFCISEASLMVRPHLTFLSTTALIAPHHSESAIDDQNSCCYLIMKCIDFCEYVMLFTMEIVFSIVISLRVSFSDFWYRKIGLKCFLLSHFLHNNIVITVAFKWNVSLYLNYFK